MKYLKIANILTHLCLFSLLLLNCVIFCQNTINNNKTSEVIANPNGSAATGMTPVVPKRARSDGQPNSGSLSDGDRNTDNESTTPLVTNDSEEESDEENPSGNTSADHTIHTDAMTETETESAGDLQSGTTEEDLGYDDEPEGQCDNESLLSKMIAIHEENKNISFVKHVNHINETFDRINHIRHLYNEYFAPKKGFGTELLAFVSSIDIVLTPECFASFFSLISGLRNNKLWANKFMDTMGRFFESGTADGKHSSFGEYDECLELESPEDKGLVVKGQYCLVKVILPYPSVNSYKKGDPYDPTFDEEGITPFKYFNGGNFTSIIRMIENLNMYRGSTYRLGLCTPHYCKRHEVEEFINKVLYPITRLPLEVGRYCVRKDKSEDFTLLQLLSISILVVLAVIVITSTGIEIYNIIYERSLAEDNTNLGETKFADEEPLHVNPYYYTFSLVTNTRELFDQNNRFTSLDTIRLFVILHIYVFHLYNTLATIGIVTLKRPFATFPSQVLELDRYTTLRNTLIFDVLFIMSGFILSNSLLGKLDRNGSKFNYFKYITGRYFRFAVPMLGSIIFLNTLPLMGSGPIWDEGVQWVTTPCQNPLVVLFGMLFISNYNDQFAIMERQSALPFCNPSTWFVSALFQLHVIIPILIIIYYKNAKYGAYATAGAIVLGMVSSISPTLIFNILPQMQYIQIESYEELFRSFAWYHLSTTQYIASFVVGVAGGYLIRRDWNLCIEYEVMGWCASVLAIIIVYMWSNTFWKVQKSAPLFSVLLWFTFGKLAFAIAITWIFFCLCTGRARTMDYLLSWPNFQPFSRLSFSFFMIHFMVVIRRVFTVKETITMSDGLLIENSIIDIMVTFCLAYVFYALIEAPFTNLMAIWLKKDTQRDDLVGHQNGAVHNKDTPAPEPKNSISMRDMGHIHHIELEEDINKNSNFVETIKI